MEKMRTILAIILTALNTISLGSILYLSFMKLSDKNDLTKVIIVAIAVTVSVLVIKIKDENKNVPTTDETLSILKKIMRFKGQILNWI